MKTFYGYKNSSIISIRKLIFRRQISWRISNLESIESKNWKQSTPDTKQLSARRNTHWLLPLKSSSARLSTAAPQIQSQTMADRMGRFWKTSRKTKAITSRRTVKDLRNQRSQESMNRIFLLLLDLILTMPWNNCLHYLHFSLNIFNMIIGCDCLSYGC